MLAPPPLIQVPVDGDGAVLLGSLLDGGRIIFSPCRLLWQAVFTGVAFLSAVA